jgi:hypothetical protein
LPRERLTAMQTDASFKSLHKRAGFKSVVADAMRRVTASNPE